MAVYSSNDLKVGVTFEFENNMYKVVEYQHVKPGKGIALVRVKIKNLMTGSVIERTFNPSEKFNSIEVEKKEMQ